MKIDSFQGEYRWLSNFWPIRIIAYGRLFNSVEAAYQAGKTLDEKERDLISKMTASESKRFGKSVKLRSDWEEVKQNIMFELLCIKFSDPFLKAKLLDTKGIELIEGNTWNDTYWGVCRGKGQNNLGKLLMKVRDIIERSISGDIT